MIVVIVILSLAVAIVAPRLSGGLLEREGVKADANRLAAVIGHAREQAAATRRGHWLVLDLKNNSWRLRVVPHPGDPPPEGPALEGRLRDGVTYKEVVVAGREPSEDRRAEVRFAPDGWVDPAVIVLASADGAAYSIAVSAPAGRVETFAGHATLDAQGVVTAVP
jgi:Tfp pilus assembly protein FimT